MGPLLAVFIALGLNLAPLGATQVTVTDHPKPGTVGRPDTYVLTPATAAEAGELPAGTWQMHDPSGADWFLVRVTGSVLHLTDPESGMTEEIDLVASLGLSEGEWWNGDSVSATGAEPLALTHRPDGVDVSLTGVLVGEVRY
ncbi:MAG TPA: hypothetical protein PLT07_07220 [Trueperaceae bacterium]|nr:hypothetical protein [Trueperaceae bacterium]